MGSVEDCIEISKRVRLNLCRDGGRFETDRRVLYRAEQIGEVVHGSGSRLGSDGRVFDSIAGGMAARFIDGDASAPAKSPKSPKPSSATAGRRGGGGGERVRL